MKRKKIELGWSEKTRYIVTSLFFLSLMAIILTWFLEYRYFINDFGQAWNFVFGSPAPFFYNAFLMWLMLVFLWGIFEKPGTAAGAMWILLIIVSYINIKKYESRGFPLSPEDFQLASEASSLTKFVSIGSIMRVVIATALVVGLTILFNRKLAKKIHLYYRNPSPSFAKRHDLAMRLVLVLVSGLGFYVATDFVRHNDGVRYQQTFLGTTLTAWNQNRNYNENGFILGFLYNLQKLQLEAPENYSAEKIAEIKATYDERAEAENAGRASADEDDVSIVVILNESFYDPSVSFNGYSFEDYYPHTGGDVLPNLHKIMSEYPSGYMYTLDYGGGTANIEFETLTGLTNYWINTVPYTALIPKAGKIPSIAQTYKKLGYETVAIHPYNAGMYKRNIALADEGFDTFISELEMDYAEKDDNSEYINDHSAYQQTLDVLKSSEKDQVIGLITMQNHTPYHDYIYNQKDFAITSDDVDDDHKTNISVYYQSLHNSDAYLGEFIEGVEQLDKKVVVLFFGDHSAGIFDNVNYSEDKDIQNLSRVVPYFIYANYDADFATTELPTTTPNCIVNTMYNNLNWKKDALYYLLDDVCTAEPILTSNYVKDRELSNIEAIRDYELLTYDILGGKKYWMK